ncbi:MAG: MFS transporter [Rhodobacteraceae bacterium]|nr:MAG: MFS transporter [Paracoccaceae bacterium]
MTTLISFAALFLSIALVQLGSGALAPLDALSGAALGFSTAEIGLLGSAHYVGFFAGCWATPRMMARVGHSRTFGALAAVGAIGALLHPVIVDPLAWSVMRMATGVAVAGAYTVVESWLHAKAANHERGRIFGVFRMVDLVAQLGAQGLIAVLEPAAFVSYNIIALFCCLCVLPLLLSNSAAPVAEGSPALRPWRTVLLSPLGAATSVVAGLTAASFRMVGPIYGAEVGLSPKGIAAFLAAAVLGGAVAQLPVGWLSDRIDRRKVLTGLAFAAIAVCGLGAFDMMAGGLVFVFAFLFGAAAFPLYSIGAAHANDFAPPGFVVDLNASLMFLFGVGAIVSPVLAAGIIAAFGPGALFVYVAIAHVALLAFGLWRMTRRPAAPRTPYVYLPRTSFTLARLMRRAPED